MNKPITHDLLITRLMETSPNYKDKPPKVKFGKYLYGQTDYYFGDKLDFLDLADFWLACASWVSYGELDYGDLKISVTLYENFKIGACQRKEIFQLKKQHDEVINSFPELKKIKIEEGYIMNEEWDNFMVLFEFESFYVLHNWWTGE